MFQQLQQQLGYNEQMKNHPFSFSQQQMTPPKTTPSVVAQQQQQQHQLDKPDMASPSSNLSILSSLTTNVPPAVPMPGTKKNTTVVQQERKDDEIQVKIAPVQQPIIPEVASEPVDLESKYLVTL